MIDVSDRGRGGGRDESCRGRIIRCVWENFVKFVRLRLAIQSPPRPPHPASPHVAAVGCGAASAVRERVSKWETAGKKAASTRPHMKCAKRDHSTQTTTYKP